MGDINDFLCEYLGLARYNADFWNGTVFRGKRRIKIWQLVRRDREYYKKQSKAKRSASVRKDVQMLCKGKRDMILAVEVAATQDYSLPVRVMDYDAQELNRQVKDIGNRRRGEKGRAGQKRQGAGTYINDLQKEDKLIPISTIVLYCGEGVYDGRASVRELLDTQGLPGGFQGLLQNYRIRIYNLQELKEENYETSFREIVGVFKRRNSKEELLTYYKENKERFALLDEISIDVMGALIGMSKLKLFPQERGGVDMCKAFDDAMEEGREVGRAEGREEGRKQGREEGRKQGREEGRKQGREEGRKQGREEGRKQGQEQGRKEGSFRVLCFLVEKGKLDLKDAAEEVGMTEELFLESMKIAMHAQ